MAGLQRSEISFRRQGSSGLVWDDKLLSGELKKISTSNNDEDNRTKGESKPATAANGGGGRAYRTVDIEPAAEPPSPKVSAGCGVCAMFGSKKQTAAKSRKRKHGHRNL